MFSMSFLIDFRMDFGHHFHFLFTIFAHLFWTWFSHGFSIDLWVLEGWKSSGRPVGKKSSSPGSLTPPWCRVMTQKPDKKILRECQFPWYFLILYTQYIRILDVACPRFFSGFSMVSPARTKTNPDPGWILHISYHTAEPYSEIITIVIQVKKGYDYLTNQEQPSWN